MNITLLVIFALYFVATAYSGYIAIEKLKKVDIGEAERIHRYKFAMAWNSASVIGVFVILCFTNISFGNIGFRNIVINFDGISMLITISTLIICSLLIVVFVYQMLAFMTSKKYQATMKTQMDSMKSSGKLYDNVVNNLIPRTKREKFWFFFTALAAGICEEIVFRGFLLFLLGSIFNSVSTYFLVIMIGVVFGLAHFYQGARGVCKTALIGILFGLLYVCTASIYPCILLHFLFDISSSFLYPSESYTLR